MSIFQPDPDAILKELTITTADNQEIRIKYDEENQTVYFSIRYQGVELPASEHLNGDSVFDGVFDTIEEFIEWLKSKTIEEISKNYLDHLPGEN